MHIAFAHHMPLPVARYGGVERVLYWLMLALVKRGHRVTLIGHPDSKVQTAGIQLVPCTSQDWPQKIPRDVDLVHLGVPWHQPLPVPYVCQIGGNGKPGEVFPLNTIFVSASHARHHGSSCYVYNGVDVSEYPASLMLNKSRQSNWKRFAFLAKASWKVKNLKHCIRAIKAVPEAELEVAGGRAWWTFSRRVHSHGMVNQSEKLALLASCDALLWPVRWPEPFGVAIVEAMLAGLPVVASSYGSGPELITPEVGHLCQNYQEFAAAVAEAPRTFSPQRIRDYAIATFNSERMCDSMITCYEKVLRGEPLNAVPPQAQFTQPAVTLLPF